MAVIVGSARIDEHGKATGGAAGDQTGKECSTQNWYLHAKGWRVFRAIDPVVRAKIAACMKAACANSHIGYDQNQRNTLYAEAEKYGFDVSKVMKNVETDCSALVRVCCAYAGIMGITSSFRTVNEPAALLKTGAFVELTGSKYQNQSAYLMAGDILCTKTSGHTVVVLTDGSKAEKDAIKTYSTPGERELRNGCSGADVKTVQEYLIQLGYNLGSWGADGDFGDATQLAVEAYQRTNGHLEVDGVVGEKTLAAIIADIEALHKPVGRFVEIVGGNCFVRSAPNTTGSKLGVAMRGYTIPYQNEERDGWYLVEYNGENGWVSSKYARVK